MEIRSRSSHLSAHLHLLTEDAMSSHSELIQTDEPERASDPAPSTGHPSLRPISLFDPRLEGERKIFLKTMGLVSLNYGVMTTRGCLTRPPSASVSCSRHSFCSSCCLCSGVRGSLPPCLSEEAKLNLST